MDNPTPQPTVTPTMAPAPAPDKHDRHHRYGFNPWRIFMGLFIVLIGLAFLAQQYGWTWIHVEDIWKLWPIFIILTGLSMLARGHVISMIISIIVGVGLIIAGMVFVMGGTNQHTLTTKHIDVPAAADTTTAAIHLDTGAAKISLTGGSDKIIDGTFTSNVTTLTSSTETVGTTQDVTLKMDRPTWWWGSTKNQLDARLSSDKTVTLDVNAGASDLNFDLSTVKASDVTINSGAASVEVRLGDLVDASRVNISAGASSIIVKVPESVGVNVVVDAAVSSKTFPGFTEISKNHFQSVDYSSTTKKIDLTIQAGASSISLTRV